MFLKSKLEKWVKNKLITKKQSDQIVAFEDSVSSNFALYTFIVIGVLAISIGVISLVASNWHDIPNLVKLMGDFSILFGISFYLLKMDRENHPYIFDAVLFGFMLMCLASIGLVGQIFNLKSNLVNAFLFWSVITFPPALLSKEKIIPFVWTGVFSLTFGIKFIEIIDDFYYDVERLIPALMMITPVIVFLMGHYLFKKLPYFEKAFKTVAVFSGFIFMIIFEGIRYDGGLTILDFSPVFMSFSYMILIFAGLFLLYNKDLKKQSIYATYGALILYLISYIPFIETELVFFDIFIIIPFFLCLAVFFALENYPKEFKFATFMIAVRVFVIYMKAFGGLALTGVFLIITGTVFLLISYFWYKYQGKLNQLIKGI